MGYKDKDKQREYLRLYVAKNRAIHFKEKCCAKCGSKEKLELHHIDRSLKISHNVWTWAIKRRLEELAKCEILCNSCHKAETFKQLSVGHGYLRCYARGCRCEECRAAKKIDNAKRYLADSIGVRG